MSFLRFADSSAAAAAASSGLLVSRCRFWELDDDDDDATFVLEKDGGLEVFVNGEKTVADSIVPPSSLVAGVTIP